MDCQLDLWRKDLQVRDSSSLKVSEVMSPIIRTHQLIPTGTAVTPLSLPPSLPENIFSKINLIMTGNCRADKLTNLDGMLLSCLGENYCFNILPTLIREFCQADQQIVAIFFLL